MRLAGTFEIPRKICLRLQRRAPERPNFRTDYHGQQNRFIRKRHNAFNDEKPLAIHVADPSGRI